MRSVVPEPAATVVLVRETGPGLEVFLTRRNPDLLFLGGYHVFPGGKLDPEDTSPAMLKRCRCRDRVKAAAPLGLPDEPERALGYRVAAVREVFEETGVLLAEGETWPPAERLAADRRELHEDRRTFLSILEAEDLALPVDRLLWFARWVTPAGSPRRFEAHFFAAPMPVGQAVATFPEEIASSEWISPRAAIEKWKQGQLRIIPPTLASLDFLSYFADWAALASHLDPERIERIGSPALGIETVAAAKTGRRGG